MTKPGIPPNTTDTLRLRRVAIDTYRENVAFLHRDCALYRAEGFQALSKLTELLLTARTARDLGVRLLALAAPYLCHMRQESRSH